MRNRKAGPAADCASAAMLPGVPERRSHDYVRHGTIDLFTALNITRADFVAGMR